MVSSISLLPPTSIDPVLSVISLLCRCTSQLCRNRTRNLKRSSGLLMWSKNDSHCQLYDQWPPSCLLYTMRHCSSRSPLRMANLHHTSMTSATVTMRGLRITVLFANRLRPSEMQQRPIRASRLRGVQLNCVLNLSCCLTRMALSDGMFQ